MGLLVMMVMVTLEEWAQLKVNNYHVFNSLTAKFCAKQKQVGGKNARLICRQIVNMLFLYRQNLEASYIISLSVKYYHCTYIIHTK